MKSNKRFMGVIMKNDVESINQNLHIVILLIRKVPLDKILRNKEPYNLI